MGYYGDKFGRRAAFVTGGLIQGILGVVLYTSFASSFWVFLPVTFVWGAITIMIYTNVFAYIADNFDKTSAPFVTGVTYAVATIPTGYVGYWMFDLANLYGYSIAAAILIGVLSFALAIIGGTFGGSETKSEQESLRSRSVPP